MTVSVIVRPSNVFTESQFDAGKRWATEDWPDRWSWGYGPSDDPFSLSGDYSRGYAAGMLRVSIELLSKGK